MMSQHQQEDVDDDVDFPFALTQAEKQQRQQQQHHVPQHMIENVMNGSMTTTMYPTSSSVVGGGESYMLSTNSLGSPSCCQPPSLLESSVISSSTAASTTSTILHNDSQYLDTAASILSPHASLLVGSSSSASRNILSHDSVLSRDTTTTTTIVPVFANDDAPTPEANNTMDRSVGFSQLMNEADDRRDVVGSTHQPNKNTKNRLPVLPEEASIASADSISPSSFMQPSLNDEHENHERLSASTGGGWMSSSSFMSSSQQTILAAAGAPPPTPSIQRLRDRTEERRLASLAGATANRTGESTFNVSIDIVVPISALSSSSSVQDVMNVVGNPDLLRLWCDPIRALIVTQSSEGVRNAADQHGRRIPQEGRGEYEGEWIEATTTQLVHPTTTYTTCVYTTGRAMATFMGFPSYGKVVMFVERQRGQVGLTIGRFAGNVEVVHKINVLQVPDADDSASSTIVPAAGGCKIRITDDVRLRRAGGDRGAGDRYDDSSLCGVVGVVERCLLPTLDDYMDQVLGSMARLRFLVENGEVSSSGRVGPHVVAPASATAGYPMTARTPLSSSCQQGVSSSSSWNVHNRSGGLAEPLLAGR